MTAEARVHLFDFRIRRDDYGRCGRAVPRGRVTEDLSGVTCRLCRARSDEDYASKRDGIDYRRLRDKERRAAAADRATAARIIVERHREEFEMEFALLRLARRH